MIKELISTSSKPGVKPATAATRPTVEPPLKVAAAEVTPPAPAVRPAEKTPEPTPTAQTKPAEAKSPAEKIPLAAATGSEADVTKALLGWASAWSHKDVKSYLSYYANDFQPPNGLTRKAWEAERSQRIDKPGKLQIKVEDIKVSVAGDKATVA